MGSKEDEQCVCEGRIRHLEQQMEVLTGQVATLERSLGGIEEMKEQMTRLEASVEKALTRMLPRVEMLLVELEDRSGARTAPAAGEAEAATAQIRYLPLPSSAPPPYEEVASGSSPYPASGEGSDKKKLPLSPLALAAAKGYASSVETLLRCGAASDKEQVDSALMVAVNAVVVRVLLDAGANPNAQDMDGRSALHHMTQQGLAACVAQLLVSGVDPEVRDHQGDSALHVAAREGRVDVVRVLLDAGVSRQAINGQGQRPYDLAVSHALQGLLRP